jgi:hypothetical protein
MKMSKTSKILTLILLLSISILLLSPDHVSAKRDKKSVTPYGDFCNRVSHYGTHKHMLDNKQVKIALEHYFGRKGFSIEIVNSKGQFVKAAVKDSAEIVDIIIFDRQTGRIRSVY